MPRVQAYQTKPEKLEAGKGKATFPQVIDEPAQGQLGEAESAHASKSKSKFSHKTFLVTIFF